MNKELVLPRHTVFFQPKNDNECVALEALRADLRYSNAVSWREQVGIICQYLRADDVRVSYSRIASLWGVSANAILEQEKKFQNGVGSDGRPPCLNDGEYDLIRDFIFETIQDHYPTFAEVSDFIFYKFEKVIKTDTLTHALSRHFNTEFKTVTGVPMEKARYAVSPEAIDNYYLDLERILPNIHPYFVYNLDEVGEQEFNDAREITLIVPLHYEKATAPYPVNRTQCKRFTALACICTNGDWINPLIITTRKTIDSELFSFVPSDKFLVKYQAHGFMTTSLFMLWFQSVFLVHLVEKRRKYNYNGPVLLIMDNFIAHQQLREKFDLDALGIVIEFLPPHSSDQTQALDLTILGEQKRKQQQIRSFKWVTEQSNNIVKLVKSLWQASNPTDVLTAFRASGIVMRTRIDPQNGSNTCYLEVNRAAAVGVRHYCQSVIENMKNSGKQISQSQEMAQNHFSLENIHNDSYWIRI